MGQRVGPGPEPDQQTVAAGHRVGPRGNAAIPSHDSHPRNLPNTTLQADQMSDIVTTTIQQRGTVYGEPHHSHTTATPRAPIHLRRVLFLSMRLARLATSTYLRYAFAFSEVCFFFAVIAAHSRAREYAD